jgi:hypothetical protein
VIREGDTRPWERGQSSQGAMVFRSVPGHVQTSADLPSGTRARMPASWAPDEATASCTGGLDPIFKEPLC